jgi:uncharacterized protein (DUF1499 family)
MGGLSKMRFIVLAILGIVVAVIVYVRLAPHDVTGIHAQADARGPGDYGAMNGFLAVRQITVAPEVILSGIAQTAQAADRTNVLAGSAGEGMITFVTRSKLWGFPDYTTVSIIPAGAVDNAAPLLMLDGRLRFGRSDFGVNKARIEMWLSALGPLTVPLDSATSE